MWANYNGVTTRCSAIMRDCEVGRKPWARRLSAGHVCAGQSLFPTFRMGASACHRRVWTQLLVLLGRTRHHNWWCWHSWGHDPLGDAPADAGPSRRLCRGGQSEGDVRRGRFRGHRDDEGGGVGHAPTRHAPHVLTAVSTARRTHDTPDTPASTTTRGTHATLVPWRSPQLGTTVLPHCLASRCPVGRAHSRPMHLAVTATVAGHGSTH